MNTEALGQKPLPKKYTEIAALLKQAGFKPRMEGFTLVVANGEDPRPLGLISLSRSYTGTAHYRLSAIRVPAKSGYMQRYQRTDPWNSRAWGTRTYRKIDSLVAAVREYCVPLSDIETRRAEVGEQCRAAVRTVTNARDYINSILSEDPVRLARWVLSVDHAEPLPFEAGREMDLSKAVTRYDEAIAQRDRLDQLKDELDGRLDDGMPKSVSTDG